MRQAVVAPFYMLRVGGLPSATLDELCLKESVRALDDLRLLETQLDALRPPLEQCLFRLVPQLDENRNLRRAILALKRDIHNTRPMEVSVEALCNVREQLPASERSLLDEWVAHMQSRSVQFESLSRICTCELRAVGERLAAIVQAPDISGAIALASPDFAQALTKGGTVEDWAPTGRLARTGVSYATRAAVKTSPFSTLTRVAFGGQGPSSEGTASVITSVRRNLVLTLLYACARDPELCQCLSYEINTGMWNAGERIALLSPLMQVTGDLVSRQERTLALHATNPVLKALSTFTRGTYSEVRAILPPGADHETVVQLINLGLVFPVAPWTRDSRTPLRGLAAALRFSHHARACELAEIAEALENLALELRGVHGASRNDLLRSLRTKAEEAFRILNASPPYWLTQHSLVYEDAADQSGCPDLGKHIRSDLQKIAERQGGRILRAAAYEVVRDQFVEQFGAGSECQDVLPFLNSFLSDPRRSALLQDALKRDMLALLDPEGAEQKQDSGPSSALPACSVFFQVAAKSQEAVIEGDYLLVVNRYNSGLGGLIARFASLFPSVSASLKEWLHDLYPDAELVDFPLLADCNNLQVSGAINQRALYWPTETPTTDSEPVLRLKNIRLRHAPSSDSLILVDDKDVVIAPAYLGVIPDYLIGGAMRLFFMLLNPWLVADTLRPAVLTGEPAPVGIEFTPRVQEGRIVYERAKWRMPPAQFPLRQRGEADLSYLRRVHHWRQANNLPEEVFLKVEEQQLAFDSRKRKPTWVSFSCLHSLEAAKHVIDGRTVAVILIEALPDRSSHWVRAADGTMRATEFVTLIRWSKDVAEEASHAAD